MLRDPNSMYINGRHQTLLKFKKYFDEEATIIGILIGLFYILFYRFW